MRVNVQWLFTIFLSSTTLIKINNSKKLKLRDFLGGRAVNTNTTKAKKQINKQEEKKQPAGNGDHAGRRIFFKKGKELSPIFSEK